MEKDNKTNPPSQEDEDGDVVGFADAPRSRWEASTARTSQPPTEAENETVKEAIQNVHQPTSSLPDYPTVLTGWRDLVGGFTLVTAILLPWILSMIVSYMPLTKISLSEAPKEVLVSIVASTTEFSILFLRFFTDLCIPSERVSEVFTQIMILFIVLCPMVTGSYVWDASNHLHCEINPHSSACRVGAGFIRAVGCFRVFGVIGIFALGLWISELVKGRMEVLQKRVNAADEERV